MKGTSNFTSFEAKKLVDTYGANNAPIYFNNGVPTILNAIGSNTQPVFVNEYGAITPLTYVANRLYYSANAEGNNVSNNFLPTLHFANEAMLAINSIQQPDKNFYVNGTARIGLGISRAIDDQSFIIGTNLDDHISFGKNGLQAYTGTNTVSALLINPYGGSIQIGSSAIQTTGIYYGKQIFKTISGFLYEGIQINDDNLNHPIWMSDTNALGTPAYNNQISYNPYTGFLILNNSEQETGGIKSTSGQLTVQSATNLGLLYGAGNNAIFSMGILEVIRLNKFGKVIINGNNDIAEQSTVNLYVMGTAKISGNTQVDTLTITNTDTEGHLIFSNANADNYIIVPLNATGTRLVLASATNIPYYIWNATSYIPANDASSSLGSDLNKWSKLYIAANTEDDDYAIEFINKRITRSRINSTLSELNLFSISSIKFYPTLSDNSVGVEINDTSVVPFVNNQITLGTTTAHWAALFIGTQNIYGSNTNPIYWANGLPCAITYNTNRLYYSAAENSFEATNHYTNGSKIALGWYVDHSDLYSADSLLYVNGTTYLNGGTTIAGSFSPSTDNRFNLGTRGTNRFAHIYIGTEDTYGNNINPIFWNDGVPTPSTATVGSITRAMYLNDGILTALEYEPNRIYYGENAISYTYTKHYIDTDHVAINWYVNDEVEDYSENVAFYVNGNSVHNGDDTHNGNILPKINHTNTLGSTDYRWRNGFFSEYINIGNKTYTTASSSAAGTWIEPGMIKLRTDGASIIDMNYNLSANTYNTRLIADDIGRLHIQYSARPNYTFNDRTTVINLLNEGTFYSQGNIETSAQVRINGNNKGTGFYLDNNTVSYASLYIQSVGNSSVSGEAYLVLGNTIMADVEQARGRIRLYSNNNNYTDILSQSMEGNYEFYLPNYKGPMYAAHTIDNKMVGKNESSKSQPVYVSGNGRIDPITTSIATQYGGTGNDTFTANCVVYTSSATVLSSSSIKTDGNYLSNISYININNNTNTDENYRLYVNGASWYGGDLTIKAGNIVNFSGNNQYIKWNADSSVVDNVRSWYGIGTSSGKLYIANAPGIQMRANTGSITIKSETSSIELAAPASNIKLSSLTTTNAPSMTINTSNQILFVTGDKENSISLRNNNSVIPNTGNATGSVGSLTKPVYINEGVISILTYDLKATVEEGTANTLAYYKTANEINDGSIETDGSYLRNIGGYNNSSYALSTASLISESWVRTAGNTGWYNEDYEGGWYMTDENWIRNYNNKDVLISGELRTTTQLSIGTKDNTTTFYIDNSGNGYISNILQLGGTDTDHTDYKLYINGSERINGNIIFSNSDTAFRGMNGTIGETDMWRIGGRATQADTGYLEIATANEGTEQIYVRQYTGTNDSPFSAIKRTLTLLDADGNTTIPGRLFIQTNSTVSNSGGTGSLVIGKSSGAALAMDVNKIIARSGSAATTLYLQNGSGNVEIQAQTKILRNAYPLFTLERSDSGETSIYFINKTAGWAIGINAWSVGAGTFAIGQYSGSGSSYWRLKIDNNGYIFTSSYLNLGGGHEKNASSPTYVWGSNSSDSYLRSYRTDSLNVAYAVNATNATNATNSTNSSYVSYQYTNEINFKGGRQSSVYFNYRNGDDGSTGTSVDVTYYFENYAAGYSNTKLYAGKIYNAVWNDIAECRLTADIQIGQVVVETPSGMMIPSTERLQAGARITSDTYGYCMGNPEDDGTPIAIAGRVLAYPYRDKNEYKLGAAVCAAPGGTVDIMTRDEIMMYPDRIIGTVSEIPNYETWDGHHKKKDSSREPTEIKGRIWVYVR